MNDRSDTRTTAFADALAHAEANQWEMAYEALLRFCRKHDDNLFEEFRSRNCKIESREIENLDFLGCSTLVIAISRQIRWDEPPMFSINGNFVDLEPMEFTYERQIEALIARLKKLDLKPQLQGAARPQKPY